MALNMSVGLLGPVVASVVAPIMWREIELGPPRQRALFAVLAMHARRVVSREELVEAVWGLNPPATVDSSIYTYVARLRRKLEPLRANRAPSEILISAAAGYMLQIDPAQVDVRTFEHKVEHARRLRAAGRLDRMVAELDSALRLWRGAALAGTAGPFADVERARLHELRFAAVEERIGALIDMSRHAEVVGELSGLVRRYPLRQRIRSLLMVAYHQSGRTAEALAEFRDVRHRMIQELGIEPSDELQSCHTRILRGDLAAPRRTYAMPAEERPSRAGSAEERPASAMPAAGQPVYAAPVAEGPAYTMVAEERPVHASAAYARPAGARSYGRPADRPAGFPGAAPAQLQRRVPGFTGRSAELEHLRRLVARADSSTESEAILITGSPGVGKSALAVQIAHEIAHRFPDGQLHLNVGGLPGASTPTTVEALRHLLAPFGHQPSWPADQEREAARYRSLMAGRRVLIVLDNVESADQVRPLLPGTGSCLVFVTGRTRLSGLVARDGARQMTLDVMPEADAVTLLREVIGSRSADLDQAALRGLAAACGHLPLALRAAAHRVAIGSCTVDELVRSGDLLTYLDVAGDELSSPRASFSRSYAALRPDEARLFRLLGLYDGAHLDLLSVSAVADTYLDRARLLVDGLLNAHLLEEDGAGRLSMHRLMRGYAKERSLAEDSPAEREQALGRLIGHYLRAADSADSADSAESGGFTGGRPVRAGQARD
ncbi:DNA-binding transcriptional activator of the SARP family [Sinosporangium album]|uniref:DNA-binding transcriptional activator of the SARP family n=1 Tax=Sinosporangium album TaxID=504805 RepID=A0A1G8GIG1_9ACTN|nr:AfsR/SARP family transcriptional regulator [Sinosporangium album]SDH94173.1 DNA-binding transcriptional activator of the SARP family [Sinosporangium album]